MSKFTIVAILLVLGATALQVKRAPSFIQMKSKSSCADAPDFVSLETGTLDVMVEDENDWHTVTLRSNYENPVVMVEITTYNGGHPVHPRVREVTKNSFQFIMEEWQYLDQWHTTETVNYMVAEAGEYELACGASMIVGQVSDMHEQWVNVSFGDNFQGTPTVLSLTQTETGGHPIVTRHRNIDASGFEVRLQEEEALGEHPAAEVVGFFAIEQGVCESVVAQTGENIYEENWEVVDFGVDFGEKPVIFAQMQSFNGGNTCNLRMQDLTSTQCSVFVEEETSNDDETNHLTEVVGFFAVMTPHTLVLEIEDHCSPEEPEENMCDYVWDCDTVWQVTMDGMSYFDTDMNGQINANDAIEQEHLDLIVQECDEDGNGQVDMCELYQCAVRFENSWRDEHCPEAGHIACDCPITCEGEWNCDDIHMISQEIIQYYDTDGDHNISLEDNIEQEHYDILVEYCDENGDGVIDDCEVHSCVVMCENEWRTEYCAGYPHIQCDCPFWCPNAWDCADIQAVSAEIMSQMDTTNDGVVDSYDSIEDEHLDFIMANCDMNGDAQVDICELFNCMNNYENAWRDENCPNYGHVYCDCPFEVVECDGAWDCQDIEMISNEVMAYADTNGDGSINLGDDIDSEHLDVMMEYCDTNGDMVIDACEVHACVVMCENEWRAEYCPHIEPVICQCPFTVEECEGLWTCADIEAISIEIMNYYDTNDDNQLNTGDNIDSEHLDIILEYCDADGNNQVDQCEVHACVVACENEWRAEYCPEYGSVYCDCPFVVITCDGAWDCADIESISLDAMASIDTNGDGQINLGDEIDGDHYEVLVEYCDQDGDGSVDACEVHACVVQCENAWRDEYCPGYGHVYCDCPFGDVVCDGAWSCEDISAVSMELLNYYDTNYSGTISLEDDIQEDHYAVLQEYCDFNNDGTLDACEIHDCVVMVENEWRAQNCPDYGYAYCDCPFEVTVCEGAWNCDDIEQIAIEMINYYDPNYDGVINPQDDIDMEHYEILVEYCDYDNDGSIDMCEVHQCIIDIENEWRQEYCEGYGSVACDCPFYVEPECEGEWNCTDIEGIALEVMAYYDVNADGSIDLNDEIEESHYEVLVEYCDFNGDGSIEACEAHQCIVDCENEWRDINCPEGEHVYCDCPF